VVTNKTKTMKAKVKIEQEIEIVAVNISVPVRYKEEDIPNNFPLRDGEMWHATVDIDTGKIEGWPEGVSGDLYMNVCDEGMYLLIDVHGQYVAKRFGYVPHGVVPGEYGDYIDLKINAEGVITNWPAKPNVSAFFEED
jgi:hypothetical protein